MSFHSPGHGNQSKSGSNPYAKDVAASAATKGEAPQAAQVGQKNGGSAGDGASERASTQVKAPAQGDAPVQQAKAEDAAREGRVYQERSVMHIDPMSALKVGFLLSACMFLVWVVAAVVIYLGLAIAGVWERLNGLIGDLTGTGEFGFGAYIGIVFALGLMELVVLTLLAPVAAMAYNASAALIGGLRIKLDN